MSVHFNTRSNTKLLSIGVLAFLIFLPLLSFSDGTKQLAPSQSDELKGNLQMFDNNTITRPFMSYASDTSSRLYIHICKPGETIYLGFKQTDNDVYFRLRDPDGNLVIDTTKIPNTNGKAGYINSYAEAVAGPRQIVGAAGYLAIVYTPLKTGDYYIEANPKKAGQSANTLWIQKRVFTYFDITVASGNTIIPGRLWSRQWDINCNSGTNQFKCSMFIYSNDGIVTKINFNGIQPFGFTIACNSSGVTKSANAFTDRESISGNVNYPSYKIFLTDPDNDCYPTGKFGGLTGDVTISGCDPKNRCINVPVDKAGNANLILDLNDTAGYQPKGRDRLISFVLKSGSNCIPWDSRDGLGNLVTPGTSISLELDYFNGITHLPLFDVENHPKGFIVDLVRPAGPSPKLYWDDSRVAGGTTNLTGCISAAGCHSWCCGKSPDGKININDWGDQRTINTWWYANIITANVNFNVTSSIGVDANTQKPPKAITKDSSVCDNIQAYQLAGAVTTATGGVWSGGNGTFSPDRTSLNAIYTPTAAEKSTGSVLLKLTSTGNGLCPASSDSMHILFKPGPRASAGADVTVCGNNPVLTLAGSVTIATGGIWSGSPGSFTPDVNTLKAVYTPNDSVVKSGKAQLILTSTGNGSCPVARDTVIFTYTPTPVVNAGKDSTICENNATIKLKGSISVAPGGTWSGGSGTFTPSPSNVTAIYTPSATEISNGAVTLTLSSTAFGSCIIEKDQVTIAISPKPIADAGSDVSVCSNKDTVQLNGKILHALGGTWSGGKGSFRPSTDSLTAKYVPTATELTAGKVILILGSRGNGNCIAVTDSMSIYIYQQPTVSAGAGKFVCSNNAAVTLNGSFTIASGITWSSASGAGGTFVPNANTPGAIYTPSLSEITTGVVPLVITTNSNGACNAVKDTVLIGFTPSPTADAGTDQSICKNNTSITLSGTANATKTSWSGGGGIYTPNANALNALYKPTNAELTAGSVTLTLTSTINSCLPVTDKVKFTFNTAPTVKAGNDQILCANNANVKLNGSFTVSSGATWAGGAGTYNPDASTVNATYSPTSSEISVGALKLYITSSGNGNCTAVTDTVLIKFTTAPIANAGTDLSACKNNPSVTLAGNVSTATGGTWSGGAGTYTPNASSLTAGYTAAASEVAAGSVTLTLTSTGNGNCKAVTDKIKISLSPAPTNAPGAGFQVCADNASATLNGAVTVASGGIWSGGNGSFQPNPQTLNALYTPSAAEIQNGSATLILTTTNNGNCSPVNSTIKITIKPSIIADAGPDQVICGASGSIQLNGSITNASGGTWSSSGTGSFLPDANTLNAKYQPSPADKIAKKIILTLSSKINGVCTAVTDDMVINFTSVPSVNAGQDQVICTNDLPIKLSASGSPATWSGGSGIFSPDASTLNAVYTPTAAEISSGNIVLTITTHDNTTACPQVSDKIKLTIPAGPKASAGTDQTICGNTATVSLSGTVSGTATGGIWNTSGTGNFSPNAGTLNSTYNLSKDDKTIGHLTFTLYTIGNGVCSGDSDVVTINISPEIVVNAGPDQTVCADAQAMVVNGTVKDASGGSWKTSGTGTFSPDKDSLITSYLPSAADVLAKKVTLTLTSTGNGSCAAITDKTEVNITPAPTVTAGADMTICADSSYIVLNGSVTVASGVVWSSDGSGSFSPSSSALKPSYYPSSADISSGSVHLTVASDGNGSCNAVSKQLQLTITPAVSLNAGTDETVCADLNSIPLDGHVLVSSGGLWKSSGTGAFSPGPNTLNASYIPSAADKSSGLVTLTLTTTGNGACKASSATKTITITPVPMVEAGPDLSACADKSSVSLLGSVKVAAGGAWSSSGTGSFVPDVNTLNASYFPSAADKISGKVKLKLRSTGNGTCHEVSDSLLLTITPIPAAHAGNDQSICADSIAAILSGSVTNAGGGLWSSTGTGNFFPNSSALNSKYAPSAIDIQNGKIQLILSSTSNGSCAAASDTLNIMITPAPSADAGADTSVCASVKQVQLKGKVLIANGGSWSTSGTGNFVPDKFSLQSQYMPSPADINVGNVVLTLTSTGNGNCKPVTSQKKILLIPAPVPDAGADQQVCADLGSISLNGKVKPASASKWTSSGSGIFSPDANTSTVNYIPSTTDKISGNVTLFLTALANAICPAMTDTLNVSITPSPAADAGNDQEACADATGITLNGQITIASGGIWTSTGSGQFSPSATKLNAVYEPSASDVATGTITLTLTSTGNKTCRPVSDLMKIKITPAPVIDAGSDQNVCSDFEGAPLTAIKTIATGIIWTSSGTGSFAPDAMAENAVYTASASDISAGNITLTATTTGNGTCKAVSDKMLLSITPKPTLNAGPDINVCPDATNIQLNGNITVATGGTWSTFGNGSFSSNNNNLTNMLDDRYNPSAADVSAGAVTLQLVSAGNGSCNFLTDEITITFSSAPLINAGPDKTVCNTNFPIMLEGSGTSGTWSGGTGTFTPNASTLNASYTPSAAEVSALKVKLYLASSSSGSCVPSKDTVEYTFTDGPVAKAGSDQMICANGNGATLNGIVLIAGGGLWTSSGNGTFKSTNTSVTTKLDDVYLPSTDDISADSVKLILTTTGNLGCQEVKDDMTIQISPLPRVSAGSDQTICADAVSISINGTVDNAGGGLWTAAAGPGSFGNNTVLSTTYTIQAADRSNGHVSLVLNSTGNGNCGVVTDTSVVTITPAPASVPGTDQNICADVKNVILSGQVQIATGGIWSSSGTGNFSPSISSLNAKYIPSAADTASKNLKLTLTTTGNGTCQPVSNFINIKFAPVPLVDAGGDMKVCADIKNITLHGEVTNASGGLWSSSGSGTFTTANTDANALYVPSKGDRTAGGVILTYTSQGNGVCHDVDDFAGVSIIPMPSAVVNAGFDQTVCADIRSVSLNGNVKLSVSGVWSGTGSGTFSPNQNTLNATYLPSAADKTKGSVSLILTTVGNGLCNPVSDTMVVTIVPAPQVNAGPSVTVCADTSGIKLNGKVTNALGGIWQSSGSGFFAPDASSLNATYVPSAADLVMAKIGLTLVSTGNGTCNAVQSGMVLTITIPPTVNAGIDQEICKNTTVASLIGSKTIAKGSVWSSSGTGSFLPDEFTLNAQYNPSDDDKENGMTALKLTTTQNGNCKAVSDIVLLKIAPDPIVIAGIDKNVCADVSSVELNGNIKNANSGNWSTSGSGTFIPGSAVLGAAYHPSAADIASGAVNITLTSSDNGTCVPASDKMLIKFLPKPTAIADSVRICNIADGTALKGSISNASGGKWSSSGSGTFGPNPFSLQARYYPSQTDINNKSVDIILSTTGNGICKATSDTTTLSITPPPVADAGNDQAVCRNASTNLVAGTVQGLTYNWEKEGGGNLSNESFTSLSIAATSRYILSVTDKKGCTSSDTVTITAIDPPGFSMDDHFCYSDSLVVYSNPSNLPPVHGVFQWYRDKKAVFAEVKPVIVPGGNGIFTIQYSYGKCSSHDSTDITNPPFLITPDVFGCIGRNVSLATSTATESAYTWTFNKQVISNINPASTISLKDTNYYNVTVKDKRLCVSYDRMQVVGLQIPKIKVTSDTLCKGDSALLTASPSNAYPSGLTPVYTWRKNGQNLQVNTASIHVLNAGTYTVLVSVEGCDTTGTSNILINPLPDSLSEREKEFCKNREAFALLQANTSAGLRYLWETGNRKDTLSTLKVDNEGVYYVVMSNKFACTKRDSIVVTEVCPPVVYIPTGFKPGSPDESGKNATFQIFGKDFTEYKLIVFSRWGEVIFVSHDKNESWDGTYRGQPMPTGTYPYLVTYHGKAKGTEGPHKMEGTVTIIR